MKRLNKRNGFLSSLMMLFVFLILATGCRPENVGTDLAQKGEEALNAGEWGDAIDLYSQAIEKNSENADFYYGRCGAHLAKGKEFYLLTQAASQENEMEKAKETAAKADEEFRSAAMDAAQILKIVPNYFEAYYVLGCIAIYQADWNGAIEAFSETIRINPEFADAYQRRGETYGHMNDWENESADLKRAAELDYSSEEE